MKSAVSLAFALTILLAASTILYGQSFPHLSPPVKSGSPELEASSEENEEKVEFKKIEISDEDSELLRWKKTRRNAALKESESRLAMIEANVAALDREFLAALNRFVTAELAILEDKEERLKVLKYFAAHARNFETWAKQKYESGTIRGFEYAFAVHCRAEAEILLLEEKNDE
jgi:hypothetical protein